MEVGRWKLEDGSEKLLAGNLPILPTSNF